MTHHEQTAFILAPNRYACPVGCEHAQSEKQRSVYKHLLEQHTEIERARFGLNTQKMQKDVALMEPESLQIE